MTEYTQAKPTREGYYDVEVRLGGALLNTHSHRFITTEEIRIASWIHKSDNLWFRWSESQNPQDPHAIPVE